MTNPAAFTDQEYKQRRALLPFMKRLFKHAVKYPKWLLLLMSSAVLVAVIDAAFPLLWYKFIDLYVLKIPIEHNMLWSTFWVHPFTQNLFIFISVYASLTALQALGMRLFTQKAGQIKEHVIFDLREKMFSKLQLLPFSFFDKNAQGWLSIRLTSDVNKVSEVISFGFISVISGVIMISVSLLIMFFYNWKLALWVALSVPVMLLISVKIRVLILKHSRKVRRIYSHMAAYLTESLNGVVVTKALVLEPYSHNKFNQILSALRKSSFQSSFFTAMFNPAIVITGSVVAALVIYIGGKDVLDPNSGFTLGLLAAFFGYARMIFEPIMEITRFYASAQDSLSAGERIFSLLDEPDNQFQHNVSSPKNAIQGNILIQNLHFHYNPNKPVLMDINLHIEAGSSLALVGPTGEGKSTLASIIARFYEPVQGRILLDGFDYNQYNLQDFRNHVGVVLQQTFLFSGTLLENIRYGKLHASDQEVMQILDALDSDFMSHKLQMQVGEDGAALSEAEKQWVAIARIMLKDPAVLILDEATSSMDSLIEKKVQQALLKVMKNRTNIVIAHRLSTIQECDQIAVMSKGRIAELGSHAELMKQHGKYYNLVSQQH